MSEIIIYGRFDFESGHRDLWLAHVDELVGQTRQEEGCLGYEIIPDARSSTAVFFIERYASDQAFARHADSEHLAHFRSQTEKYQIQQRAVEKFEAKKVPLSH